MKISIIIAFYKNLAGLELVLQGLQRQTYSNFEVIVAEDDNNAASLNFISEARNKFPFQIKHISHEDKGFRKNLILNKAIQESKSEFLIFLDGDCIPHKHFVASYLRSARKDTALFGRRVLLSEELTQKLYEEKQLNHFSLWSIWNSTSEDKRYALYLPFFKKQYKPGIFGCNWGIFKEKILAVNGFDEDYITAGVGEDNDIEWRLAGTGLKIRSLRYSAITYHLYHTLNYSEHDTRVGYDLLRKKKALNKTFCENGLKKS